jgi:lactoylglutathione lyase
MKYLHTMVRISNIYESLRFFSDGLNMKEVRRSDYEKGRFTLIFLATSADAGNYGKINIPLLELTYNWDPEIYDGGRNFGHLAFGVDNIYDTCEHLQKMGISILRPPKDGYMAFIKSPDGISIELLQIGDRLIPQEPWKSMASTGTW